MVLSRKVCGTRAGLGAPRPPRASRAISECGIRVRRPATTRGSIGGLRVPPVVPAQGGEGWHGHRVTAHSEWRTGTEGLGATTWHEFRSFRAIRALRLITASAVRFRGRARSATVIDTATGGNPGVQRR
ncbi:hypothetical protein AB8O38_10315 [Saccharomonospora xinjiangensis]|uniref:hypothetical protein n=1 Tax=Saccharomonospora xinjiangensis TaxID=75294 RepID=UPI00350FEF9E